MLQDEVCAHVKRALTKYPKTRLLIIAHAMNIRVSMTVTKSDIVTVVAARATNRVFANVPLGCEDREEVFAYATEMLNYINSI